jgi:serine protease Do
VARLLGRDNTRKLCLLKIDTARSLPVPETVPRSELRVGQWAISVGVGFGDAEPAISAGIISALSRISGRAVQTDANTSPANYGGPLIDLDGRVIGICVPLHPQAKAVTSGIEWYDSGIGFAIPLHGLEEVLVAMKAGKVIELAYLGIQMKPAKAEESGTIVGKVQADSPADRAKIQPGDRVMKLDGQPVRDSQHLKMLIDRHVAGDRIRLTVLREKEELDVEVTLATRPKTARPTPPTRVKVKPQPKPVR